MNKTILRVIVGSKAHGLDTPESDIDYRGVSVMPTPEYLSLRHKDGEGNVSWVEGKEDMSIYELKHFLTQAIHSNPSILEVFVSPLVETTEYGQELRSLFPCVWTSRGVFESFRGYSTNQRKKFIEGKDGRDFKFAVAYIRVLLLGIELLRNKTMTVNVAEQEKLSCMEGATMLSIPSTVFKAGTWDVPTNTKVLMGIKGGAYSKGSIVDLANYLERLLTEAYEANPNYTNDPDQLNSFLLKVRKANWD